MLKNQMPVNGRMVALALSAIMTISGSLLASEGKTADTPKASSEKTEKKSDEKVDILLTIKNQDGTPAANQEIKVTWQDRKSRRSGEAANGDD